VGDRRRRARSQGLLLDEEEDQEETGGRWQERRCVGCWWKENQKGQKVDAKGCWVL